MSSSEYRLELETYVDEAMSKFDQSHNITHIQSVYQHACDIASRSEFQKYFAETKTSNWYLLEFAAKLHDVLDHKYKDSQSVTRESLFLFLNKFKHLIDPNHVLFIMDNISYSKQNSNKLEKHDVEIVNIVRDIVSDADKLEALGEIGLTRCREYTRNVNKSDNEDEIEKKVIQHCHDKLLRLYTVDGFIRTQRGKELAKPLHEYIERFVKDYDKLQEAKSTKIDANSEQDVEIVETKDGFIFMEKNACPDSKTESKPFHFCNEPTSTEIPIVVEPEVGQKHTEDLQKDQPETNNSETIESERDSKRLKLV